MKRLLAISATAAVLVAVSPFAIAQSGDMKGMDMKDHKGMDKKGMDKKGMDKKGMDKKGMDMDKCMAMQGMDHDKCMTMMKDKKGAKKSAKKAQGKTDKGAGAVQKVDPAGK